MRQAVLIEPKHIEFRDVPAPVATDLKDHQVLINVKRIGICGSEIHSYHGQHPATFYPVVQGHEYSAVVVACGKDVTVCKPGDHITARPQLVCGECNPCKRGQYNVCEHLRVQAFQADGTAQDYFIVDDDRVVVLPEGMSLDYGAMIEPSAVGAHATQRTDVKGKNVVVSGAGAIGNLVAQFGCFYDDGGGLYTMAEDANGNEKELLMDRWWRKDRPDGTYWGGDNWRKFDEYFAKEQSILMLKGFLEGQLRLQGAHVSDQELACFARSMVEETQRKQLA